MMKTKLLTWIVFCLIFVGVGCSGNEPAVTPTATAVSQVTVPPETAVSSPTLEPTPTPTLPPPPTGQIYFLWDPVTMAEQYGVLGPFQNLYLASPGESADDWQIETLLERLAGGPSLIPSPDKTTFAINPLEDTNGDGHISTESQNRSIDWPNIHLYSLFENSLERVTTDYPQWLITVLEGNQVVAYYHDKGLVVLSRSGVVNRQLATPFSESTYWLAPSPDRQKIAINFFSSKLYLVDTQSGETIQVENDIGGLGVESTWSSDNQLLAISQYLFGHFFLVDAETGEVQSIPELGTIRYPTWSPDGQQIAMVQEIPEGSNLLLFHLLDRTSTLLLSMPTQMKELIWSPDGSYIAFTHRQDNSITLSVVNLITSQPQELWHLPNAERLHIQSWSPEGQWLLVTAGEMHIADKAEEWAGLYLVHIETGEVIQIIDTTSHFDPYAFVWLSNMENP